MMISIGASAQFSFTNKNSKLANATFHSGCAVTVVDWNNDGLDDIVRMDGGNNVSVEIQNTNGQFITRNLGDFGNSSAWAMSVADFDQNGYKDIVAGYNGTGKLLMVSNDGLTGTISTLPSSNFFWQNITCGDFNNDGFIDIFACDDNAPSSIYVNDGLGSFTESGSTIIDFVVHKDSNGNPALVGNDPADSGNYGSVFTDFDNDGDMDLYIAKCRQASNNPNDPRRIDILFVNDGNNNYTNMDTLYGVANGWQTWTASFGDIDNDGDLDLLATNHDHESQIFENDGLGYYTDITSTTSFDATDITPIQSGFEDFDNDGFIDIFITGSDERIWHNNGDKTFTKLNGLFDNQDMESFAFGDLNHDGYVDIYGSYANIYTTPTSVNDVVWMNDGGNNNFITLQLTGTVSNKDAIGARAFIYGSWGNQMREVRSGESYGTCNSFNLHFGIGQASAVDSIVVSWPSGISQTILNPAINQFVSIIESDCVSPTASITNSGTAVLCTGQSLTLNASGGDFYLWSTGETTSSIAVTTVGEYNVQVSVSGNNCSAISRTIVITNGPDETPTITAVGLTEFCAGASVTLEGPANAASYLWSNGATTENIEADQAGDYTLTVQGSCADFTSTPITVTVLTSTEPVTNGVIIPAGTSTTLTATGTNVNWYDVPTGGISLFTGNSFTTPILNTATTYYADNTTIYGGDINYTGMPQHTGTSNFSGSTSTNAKTSFDVLDYCTLENVKVYTDVPGERLIELRDEAGTLVNSTLVNIVVDSMILDLNWLLSPGVNYTIGTDAATNQAIAGWGNVAPRLKRNSSGVSYPYAIANLLSINTSSEGNGFYYYFYDWKLKTQEFDCISSRVSATVEVSTGYDAISGLGIEVYPNPASNVLNINLNGNQVDVIALYDASGRLVLNASSSTNTNIDISTLAKGVYNLQLKGASVNSTRVIVIQ